MPEFTPGPWHIYEDEDGSLWQEDRDLDGYHVVNDDGEFVARVVGLPPPDYTDPDDGMLAANARLMAAAPEMLDILRRIVAAPLGAHHGELIRRGYHLLERLGERPMPVEELRAESRQREKEHPDAWVHPWTVAHLRGRDGGRRARCTHPRRGRRRRGLPHRE